jgi:hypothetical protein
MIIKIVIAYLWIVLSVGVTFAQERGDFFDFLGGALRSPAAQRQLQNILPKEFPCIERELRARGFSLRQMLVRGAIPSEKLVSEARSVCRDSLTQAGSSSPIQGETQSY